MRLLVDPAGEQLLRVPGDERPGEDLGRCVQGGETRPEAAPHQQRPQQGRESAGRQCEQRYGHRHSGIVVGLEAPTRARAIDSSRDRHRSVRIFLAG
ncbi:MAG TPA: hypothetical protein VN520_10425 [Streptomyces sp.]|uniref:hypothetical protein n=1 Tax=Streptomyces sp. TaxID=1931 RepID=UPI002CBCABC1|nr:hypothetical protein [Streptomyces sp.]HWU06782.1 hypothetical protein [Streptomyces sp.]